MKYYVCAVHDRVAQQYRPPMFLRSRGEGIRMFTDAVNNSSQDNLLYLHADDFDLYHVGEWDDETCFFELREVPELLILGRDAKKPVEESPKLRAVN